METLAGFYPLLKTLWVVWFFLLFAFVLAWVLWPNRRRRQGFDEAARIPLRDDA